MSTSTREFDRRKFLKWGVAGLSAAFAAPLLTSCSTDPAMSGAEGAGTLIRYGGSSSSMTGLFHYGLQLAAEESGIAEIDFTDMAQATALLTMRSGSDIDAVSMSWLNLGQFRDEGHNAVAVAPMWGSPAAVIAHSDSGIKTVEDLRGRRVGIGTRQAGIYTDLDAYLKRQGFNLEEECEVTSISDQPVLVAMFESGEFDAINLVEPLVTIQIEKGAVEVLGTARAIAEENGGNYVPANSWAVSEDWLLEQEDPEAVQAVFARASEIVATEPTSWDMANDAIFNMDASTLKLWRERMSPLVLSEFTPEGLKLAQVSLDDEFAAGHLKSAYKVEDLIFP